MGIVLHLPMNAVWYEMVESLQKTHEYRDITPYWISRLIKKEYVDMIKAECSVSWMFAKLHISSRIELAGYIELLLIKYGDYIFKEFDYIDFSYGYTKRHMVWTHEGFDIREGNPEWGAKQGEPCFIIMLGRRVK